MFLHSYQCSEHLYVCIQISFGAELQSLYHVLLYVYVLCLSKIVNTQLKSQYHVHTYPLYH